MVPPDEGVESFRYKEDEETPLPILHLGSCGITVMEADIATLHSEGIVVDDDKKPTPENFMQSDDVFPTLSSLTFVFRGVNPWRQSGDLPVRRAKLMMNTNPSI